MIGIKVNFKNALYVSSSQLKDEIGIKVLEPNFFVASKDMEAIEANYTFLPV